MIACMLFDSCWGKNHSSFVNDYGLLSEKSRKHGHGQQYKPPTQKYPIMLESMPITVRQ
jgi:hypothetical protein